MEEPPIPSTREPLIDSFSELIIKLSLKLERLKDAGLAPFNVNPLIKALEKLEDKFDSYSNSS